MRSCARKDGKHVPSVDEIISIWPSDMRCPKCQKTMVLSSRVSWHLCATLQHIKDSEENNKFAICCMSCNASCRNLGDSTDAISTPDTVRNCKICKSLKSVEEFILIKNRSGNKTRTSYCNDCRKTREREYRVSNKEKRNLYKRKSYTKNRDKELARKKAYYLENKIAILEKSKERYANKPQTN